MIRQLEMFYYANKDRAFKLGTWDCSILVREWFEFIHCRKIEIDPFDKQNVSIIDNVDRYLNRTKTRATGNIALFKSNNPTLGIVKENMILALSPTGITAVKNKPLIMWSIKSCRQ